VQESLTNVVKHAQAHTISILLTPRDNRVAMVIEDDGKGFDPAQTSEERYGLVGMRERVALIGGKLTIESAAGTGTTVLVEVPLA
jgi:signal transduction histidine kinase